MERRFDKKHICGRKQYTAEHFLLKKALQRILVRFYICMRLCSQVIRGKDIEASPEYPPILPPCILIKRIQFWIIFCCSTNRL